MPMHMTIPWADFFEFFFNEILRVSDRKHASFSLNYHVPRFGPSRSLTAFPDQWPRRGGILDGGTEGPHRIWGWEVRETRSYSTVQHHE